MSTLRTSSQGASIPGSSNATRGEAVRELAEQALSPELINSAVAELRYQTAFYQEAVQAMMDGVTLGAEQVQDKRIEFLERGPSTNPETAILSFAATLVLEGTVGPAVAALATRAVIRPVMRATGRAITAKARQEVGVLAQEIRLFRQEADIYRTIGGSAFAGPRRKRRDLLQLAKKCESDAETLLKDLRGKRGSARSVRDTLDKVTTFTQDNLVAVVKGANAVADMPGSSQALDPDITPGVEVRAAAMASASKLRLHVAAVHEALEERLKSPGIKVDEARKILTEYWVEFSVDLAYIRESFQVSTEAMIWAKMLLDQVTIEQARDRAERAAGRDLPPEQRSQRLFDELIAGRPSTGFVEDASFLELRVDDKIKDYLTSRFRKELERWIVEYNRNIPLRRTHRRPSSPDFLQRQRGSLPKDWWDKLQRQEREDFLVQYLVEVAEGTPPELQIMPGI